ncbi:DNA-directed RNA polymerase subunit beta [Siminovitchia acidinfaciens]|uniref:DNA-directed RNA polymerase subunit beta n=1 Tax=Siminovitchia acidinfaciens TaxID=2321395 RepID=A0A429Y6T0_9BACI|nr:DNA-directed RNA polymerase subunit beta [Siminovitchia acidinfaciens]RST77092.1 DNA-directed RNA polymerase subunit beta [Siminovitchia acidinfaciens]
MTAKFISKEQTKTREQTDKKRSKEKNVDESLKKIKVRLIPIWLRVLIIIFFTVISLIAGILVGYAVIGDGKPQDALKKETWTHIIDLVNKEK